MINGAASDKGRGNIAKYGESGDEVETYLEMVVRAKVEVVAVVIVASRPRSSDGDLFQGHVE
jgi:hypothetical protein